MNNWQSNFIHRVLEIKNGGSKSDYLDYHIICPHHFIYYHKCFIKYAQFQNLFWVETQVKYLEKIVHIVKLRNTIKIN